MSEGRGRHVYLGGPRGRDGKGRGAGGGGPAGAAPAAVRGPCGAEVLPGGSGVARWPRPAASLPPAPPRGEAAQMSPCSGALSVKLNVGVLSAGCADLNAAPSHPKPLLLRF